MSSRTVLKAVVAGMLVWAGLSGGAQLAAAQSEPSPEDDLKLPPPKDHDAWEARPTALDLHLGLATPQGELGLSLTHAFRRFFTLSGSVGIGWTGPHASVMPRLQIPWESGAVGLGLGLTMSKFSTKDSPLFCFTDGPECDPIRHEAEPMVWTNAELYYISQSQESGFRFGVYLGRTEAVKAFDERLTHPETGKLRPVTGDNAPRPVYPYLGIVLGTAF